MHMNFLSASHFERWMNVGVAKGVAGLLSFLLILLAGCATNFDSDVPQQIKAAAAADPELAKEYSEGVAVWRSRDWVKSVSIWEHGYAHSKEKYGPDHITTQLAGYYLGDSYGRLQKVEKSLTLLEDAARASTRILGPDHLYTGRVLDSLSETYLLSGRLEKAVDTSIEALRIKKIARGNHSDEYALSSIYVANAFSEIGDYETALKTRKEAYQIWLDLYGSQHPKTLLALSDIAQAQSKLGNYKEALEIQKLILESNANDNTDKVDSDFISLSNIAVTYQIMGNISDAVSTHKKAISLIEGKYGKDHPYTAIAKSNLGVTYSEIGQFSLAKAQFLETIRGDELNFGNDSLRVATTLENLAETEWNLAEVPDAFAAITRAIKIYQATPQAGLRGIRAVQRNARFLSSAGMFEGAKAMQENLLPSTIEWFGANHFETALAKNDLGITLSRLGDHQAAFALKVDALQITERTFGNSHREVASVLQSLAADVEYLYGAEGAIALRKQAVDILQLSRKEVSKLGTKVLASYTSTLEDSYQSLASLLIDQGRLSEAQQVLDMLKEDEQFDFVRRSGDAYPRDTRVGYTNKEKKWMGRYREISDRIALLGAEERDLIKLQKSGLNPEQLKRQKALQSDLKVAQDAFFSFMGEMRQTFSTQGASRSIDVIETSEKTASELLSIVRSLGDEVVLIRYFVTDDQVGMLITTSGVPIARNFKISGKELNRQIGEFRRVLRDPKIDPLPMANALYKVLFGPVENDLNQSGAKTVMLSLDGALRYLPFGALHDGQQYAAQRWDLPIYTSVVREKLRDNTSLKWQVAGLGVTRAMGAFSALPAVKSEMSRIVKVGNGVTGLFPGELYLDEAFNAERLRDVGKRKFELLHVASHFQFSPGTESNSFLLLGDGQQLSLGDIRTQNYRFDNVDLLTLSACDTGLGGGRDEKGIEIEGFGVIAQQQGAKAVLATLWPVADQSTATLITDMYRRRQSEGLSKIEALRRAQVALMLQPKYAHPFYWAPFILMGNWK
jgi:CHAT domain-containing protein/tetratricopeptide (TPR) repeat protein